MRKRRALIVAGVATLSLFGAFNHVLAIDGTELGRQEEIVQIPQEDIKANKEALNKAKLAMEHKDYEAAITYLSAYIDGKPKKYEPYKLRGECYYALRRYDLAEGDFQTAIDIKSADDKFITGTKYISAVVLGADKYEQKQNPELGNLYGLLMYAQKAQNNPAYETTYSKAFEYNSHIYLPQPKKEEITKINCPQKYGVALNPTGDEAVLYEIINKIKDKKYNEAVYKIADLAHAYPEYYLTYYLTGVVMAGLEDEKSAIEAFEKALKLNPYDFESLASLGQIFYSDAEKYLSKDYAKKSIEYFERAKKLNPNSNVYDYYIGLNYLLSGENKEAIESFNSAIKLKTNDYNSIYYKLIAQYLNGDYNEVIDGTTKLLYRHVSNYNSVMYLRALAYHKLNNDSSAITDIEAIFNNMNDIYNADIKKLSSKEQTLSAYLYYLKAQILGQRQHGTKADMNKALENPIISQFVHKAPKNLVLSEHEIETQLDYIRTAFGDEKYEIQYDNQGYKISLGEVEAVLEAKKKDKAEEFSDNIEQSPVSEHLASEALLNQSLNNPKTEEELMGDGNSIAQKLAQQTTFIEPKSKETEDAPLKVSESESEEQVIDTGEIQAETLVQHEPPILREAEEIKDAVIEQEQILSEEIDSGEKSVRQIQDVEDKISEIESEVKREKSTEIREHFANVDGIDVTRKTAVGPILKEDDEIIPLDLTRKEESLADKIGQANVINTESMNDSISQIHKNVAEIADSMPEHPSVDVKIEEEVSEIEQVDTSENIEHNSVADDKSVENIVQDVDEMANNIDTSVISNAADAKSPAQEVVEQIEDLKNIPNEEKTKRGFFGRKSKKIEKEETLLDFLTTEPEVKKVKKEKKVKVKKEKAQHSKTQEIIQESDEIELLQVDEGVEIPVKEVRRSFWQRIFRRKKVTTDSGLTE